MEQYTEFFNRIVKEEEGQDIVEYALLLGFVALVALVGIKAAGTSISDMWQRLATWLGSISFASPA